ncbi:MAG: helix-turn-helix domain-containing protein [Clostridiales bacterium]|nr:helix-turn-helix domain-containing protein [Clostridiales bacterium]
MKLIDADLKFQVRHMYNKPAVGGQHNHPCYELVYYISGTGEVTIENRSYLYTEGTFSVILSNQMHFEVSNTPTEVLYIGFDMSKKMVTLQEGVFSDVNGMILNYLIEIEEEMKAKKSYYVSAMNLLTEQIVLKIGRMQNNEKEEGDIEKAMSYVANFIKMNCMNGITVNNLANSAGYSYDYFRHQFKRHFGIAAKEYIINERMRFVKELLLNTDYSIKKIAKMSSFNSPVHLNMTFKKIEKMTPLEFRSKFKAQNPYHNDLANYRVK